MNRTIDWYRELVNFIQSIQCPTIIEPRAGYIEMAALPEVLPEAITLAAATAFGSLAPLANHEAVRRRLHVRKQHPRVPEAGDSDTPRGVAGVSEKV